MVSNTSTNDNREWIVCNVPGVRVLLELILFTLRVVRGFCQQLSGYWSGLSAENPALTSTHHSSYSSFDSSSSDTPLHTQITMERQTPINVKPMLEKRPSNISYLSYAPSVWSLDNRILGQLSQLEQAQSYLFRSINILIDSQEELDEVEVFVDALSWESDLSDISKLNHAPLST